MVYICLTCKALQYDMHRPEAKSIAAKVIMHPLCNIGTSLVPEAVLLTHSTYTYDHWSGHLCLHVTRDFGRYGIPVKMETRKMRNERPPEPAGLGINPSLGTCLYYYCGAAAPFGRWHPCGVWDWSLSALGFGSKTREDTDRLLLRRSLVFSLYYSRPRRKKLVNGRCDAGHSA